MIARQHRFHGHNSLNFVYRKGRSARSGNLTLRYTPAHKAADYRLAIVVSRKVSKSAVVRNRIRRRIYEIIRLARKEAAQPWPYDMVITVFDDSSRQAPATQLKAQIFELLSKASVAID